MTGNAGKSKQEGPSPKADSKTAKVVALLSRKRGATLKDMVKATDWQEHSVRAALTGLRKKGHSIERSSAGSIHSYRIAGTKQ